MDYGPELLTVVVLEPKRLGGISMDPAFATLFLVLLWGARIQTCSALGTFLEVLGPDKRLSRLIRLDLSDDLQLQQHAIVHVT
jgi:hypothetical protein